MTLPARAWTVGVLLPLFLAAPISGAARDDDDPPTPATMSVDALLAVVRRERHRTDPAVFEELAKRADAESLTALQQCAALVFRDEALELVFASIARYRDAKDLADGARAWLAEQSMGETWTLHQPAARALAAFGADAEVELRRVVTEHPNAQCRSIAIGGLVTALRAQGDEEALELMLDCFRPPLSGSREVGVRTLKGFRGPRALKLLEAAIEDRDLPSSVRTMVVDALAAQSRMPAGGEEARELVVEALRVRETAVQLAALRAVGDMGGNTGGDMGVGKGSEEDAREVERLLRARDPSVRRAALVALDRLRGDDPAWRGELVENARGRDVALRLGAVEALVRRGSVEEMGLLQELLADEHPLVRLHVARGLGRLRHISSVPLLIDRLEVDTLRIRGAVRASLEQLTGQDHGARPKRWRAWWEAEGASFALPTPEAARAAIEERAARRSDDPTEARFFGIPLGSDRVAFVVDTSGSMDALTVTGRTRLKAVTAELLDTLEVYPHDGRFNLIFFSDRLRKWRGKLVDRTASNLDKAVHFARGQRAIGGTAIHDGLVEAFEDEEVDTIVLLTDGVPTEGKLTDPTEILDDIVLRNDLRQIVIHCVSVSHESALLRGLAEETGGLYREVR